MGVCVCVCVSELYSKKMLRYLTYPMPSSVSRQPQSSMSAVLLLVATPAGVEGRIAIAPRIYPPLRESFVEKYVTCYFLHLFRRIIAAAWLLDA